NSNADCGVGVTCMEGAVGSCIPQLCGSDGDCGEGNYTCIGGQDGTCAGGTGTQSCIAGWQCPSGICQGSIAGACVKQCTTDSDCPTELCLNGTCSGCHDDSYCPAGNCIGATPGTCAATGDTFPLSCRNIPLNPQEKALEFMLFDLTSCISPDAVAPPLPAPVPPVYDQSATFTEVFERDCPTAAGDAGDERAVPTRIVWRYLDGQATVPNSASIDVIAQTSDDSLEGGAPDFSSAQVVTLPSITASGRYSDPLDTGTVGTRSVPPPAPAESAGFFNMANPPVVSGKYLQLTFTLNPTMDHSGAPTLDQWQVRSDCVPIE
ncbi:MAG TPA: hypothetical protein VKU41_03755, partial [Polyangiaceae bacterium]|nr:hypothetical protein [Polyangiaceae bacterium]